MKKATKNIQMIETIASALGDLTERLVFIGGATTALYIDDRAAPSPTPSDDVDCIVQVASYQEFAKIEVALRKKGFRDPLPDEEAPICRKWFKDIKVDIMPTDEKILGFSNRWYPEAIQEKIKISLPSGMEIFIFPVAYFLATKLVAYDHRGRLGDPRESQDLEDICAVLDGCTALEQEMIKASPGVRTFIQEEFAKLLKDDALFEEAAHGFIRASGDPVARAKRIVQVARAFAFP